MKASDLIKEWDTNSDHNQRENIGALQRYVKRLQSKKSVVIHFETGDRGTEGSKIKFETIYECERTIQDKTILIEKHENETDQRNSLALMLYRYPSTFYHCCLAYDGKINPRILSKEASELKPPLKIDGNKVKDNDIVFIFLDNDKNKVDNVLAGLCQQKRMKDILKASAPKILVLILLKSASSKL